MRADPLTIEVLSLPGCPNVEQTLRMAREVVASVVPGTAVREVLVTEEQARGFPGSPTVLVDGRDIEGRGPNATGAA